MLHASIMYMYCLFNFAPKICTTLTLFDAADRSPVSARSAVRMVLLALCTGQLIQGKRRQCRQLVFLLSFRYTTWTTHHSRCCTIPCAQPCISYGTHHSPPSTISCMKTHAQPLEPVDFGLYSSSRSGRRDRLRSVRKQAMPCFVGLHQALKVILQAIRATQSPDFCCRCCSPFSCPPSTIAPPFDTLFRPISEPWVSFRS